MLNHITLMGRLTKDPELRYTGNQTAVASFSLAVERDRADANGDRLTDFIDCVAWKAAAEFVSNYFKKGQMMVVSGRLQFRDWEDRDGNKRRSAEVRADNIYFGESKKDRSEYKTDEYRDGFSPVKKGVFAEIGDEDGELPF